MAKAKEPTRATPGVFRALLGKAPATDAELRPEDIAVIAHDLVPRLTAALEDKAKRDELGRVAARLTFYLGALEAPHALAGLVAAEGEVSGWLFSRGRTVDAELEPEDLPAIVRETRRGPRSFRFARMLHQVREIVATAGGVRVNSRGIVEVPAGIEVPKIPAPLRMRRVPDEVARYRSALTATLRALGDTGPSIGPEDILRAAARLGAPATDDEGADSKDRGIRRAKAKAWEELEARGIVAIGGIPPRRKAGRPKKIGQRPPR